MVRKEPTPRKSTFGKRRVEREPLPAVEKPRRRRTALRYGIIAGFIWLGLAAGVVFTQMMGELPETAHLLSYEPGKDITLYDAKGRTIARRGLTQAEAVAVGSLPDYVGNAFIAVEDRRFRYHFGIDPIGLARALWTDVSQGEFAQGGSTLTQQLAKNLFLSPSRTLRRKIEEAALALRLESRFSKDEILYLYLNHVYFGAGVYGIEAASERFFGKPAHLLTLKEAAILAGSVKAPSRYNPKVSPAAASARAELVLDAMLNAGFIDETTRKAASAQTPILERPQASPGAGYFVDYVVSLVPGFVGTPKERLIVETTLDLDLEKEAEQALSSALQSDGTRLGASEGALVAMTPDGAVKALVGGRSYDDSPFNRATDALRQPGSAFKAFVYLAALEHGHKPTDTVVDGPVTIGKWAPENYEGNYEGTITLAHAFAHSSNSAAVQLTREVGPEAIVRVAHRLGIAEELHPVPSLALGTSEVSPLSLTGAYAAFANGGVGTIPYAILRIKTISGKVLYERSGSGLGRVMSPENNARMTEMMIRTVTEGTGKQAALKGRQVAGKTGTSQDYRDAWFVGFTSDYVCGVWIGNDGNTPMRKATGGGLPARIFKTFMTEAERDLPLQPLAGMLVADEAPSGEVASADAAEKRQRDKDLLAEFQELLDKLF